MKYAELYELLGQVKWMKSQYIGGDKEFLGKIKKHLDTNTDDDKDQEISRHCIDSMQDLLSQANQESSIVTMFKEKFDNANLIIDKDALSEVDLSSLIAREKKIMMLLSDFIESLDIERIRPLGKGITDFLGENGKSELVTILNYLTDPLHMPLESFTQDENIIPRIQLLDNLERIANLNPGESCQLTTEETGLERKLTIIHQDTQTQGTPLICLIESKGELQNKSSGNFKEGSIVWRVNAGEIAFYRLKTKNEGSMTTDEETRLINESSLSRLIGKDTPYITVNYVSQSFNSNDSQAMLYSLKAESDLFDFLSHDETGVLLEEKAFENDLIEELLEGLKVLHDSGVIHQDLKLENILMMPTGFIKDDDGHFILENGMKIQAYKAMITDFGLATYDHQHKPVNGVAHHYSPEVFLYIKNADHNLYRKYERKGTLGALEAKIISNIDQSYSSMDLYSIANKANDVWALGLVIFYIKNGREATIDDRKIINDDPLLCRMLDPNRATRCTINEALHIISPLKRRHLTFSSNSENLPKNDNMLREQEEEPQKRPKC